MGNGGWMMDCGHNDIVMDDDDINHDQSNEDVDEDVGCRMQEVR